jgi:hypothetical protein
VLAQQAKEGLGALPGESDGVDSHRQSSQER